MPSLRKTIVRYCIVVAAVYFLVFVAAAVLLGRSEAGVFSWRIWSLPLWGIALALFFTWVVMGRFGNMGGSIYFTPTVVHATFLIVLVFALARIL